MPTHPSRRSLVKAGGVLAAATALPAALGESAAAVEPPEDGPWGLVPQILARVTPPVFPDRWFDIRDYGAVGDGATKNTGAFRAAITACHEAGGGHVRVPEGRFLTGAVHLLSNVDLHVTEGATVLFSTDPADFLPVVFTRWEGTECYNYSSFVYAYGQENLSISGGGVLDGQGMTGPWKSWRDPGGNALIDQAELRRMGEQGVPLEERVFGEGHHLRPNMIQFYRCRNIVMRNVTVLEPPMWTIHPVLCTNVLLDGVDVIGRINNSDGVDPECCSDVHIVNCRFHTEDDSIAVKSGRDEDGLRVGVPSENIVVQNCVFSGRWGGIAVGSEMSGGARNIFAENCEINPLSFPGRFNPRHPVFLKTNKKRGGYIDGVYVRRFKGRAIDRDCIYLTARYSNQVGDRPAVIRNVVVEQMEHDGARMAINFEGLASDPFTNIRIAQCEFVNTSQDSRIEHVVGLTLDQVYDDGVQLRSP